jgi:hypothetical protein
MFCPRCASVAIEGQRFCRSCGINLGVILDAMEGKRGPIDFETLKRDLRDLGTNLRSGFEEAGSALKRTARLNAGSVDMMGSRSSSGSTETVAFEGQAPVAGLGEVGQTKRAKGERSRMESLQRGVLSLLSGGAMLGVWAYLLDRAYAVGFLESLSWALLRQTGHQIHGLPEVLSSLWLLALVPVVQGIGHLFNGLFLAPTSAPSTDLPRLGNGSPTPLSGFDADRLPPPQGSVTEDPTLRLEQEGALRGTSQVSSGT